MPLLFGYEYLIGLLIVFVSITLFSAVMGIYLTHVHRSFERIMAKDIVSFGFPADLTAIEIGSVHGNLTFQVNSQELRKHLSFYNDVSDTVN